MIDSDATVAGSGKPKSEVSKLGAYGTGKRKTSVARVWVKAGGGTITVNGIEFSKYFCRASLCRRVQNPFGVASVMGYYDVKATVAGGGLSGQAGAVAHGISKALKDLDPSLKQLLSQAGLLTRDSRVVERKKYGQHKARKKCQFSKR